MGMNIITGHTGTPHVTSEQAGAENAGIYGNGKYVFDLEQRFSYEIISNNLVRIKNGYGINQGRTFGIALNDYEDMTIDNGLAGVGRHDLIVAKYVKIVETGIESITLEVVKGTSSATPVDPTYTTGNILEGAVEDSFALYRVVLNDLSIVSVTQMFSVVTSFISDKETVAELSDSLLESQFSVHSQNVSSLSLPSDSIRGNITSWSLTGNYGLVNSVANGNFDTDTTHWGLSFATATVSNGICLMDMSASYGAMFQSIEGVNFGDYIFAFARISSISSGTKLSYGDSIDYHSGSGNYEILGVKNLVVGEYALTIGANTTQDAIYVDYVGFINMTRFGISGYTEAQMFELIGSEYFSFQMVKNPTIKTSYNGDLTMTSIKNTDVRKLPNNHADIVYANGNFDRITNNYILAESNILTFTQLTNIAYVTISKPSGIISSQDLQGTSISSTCTTPSLGQGITDDVANVWKHYLSTDYLIITFPVSKYANLAGAKTAFAGTEIIYELSSIVTTNLFESLKMSGQLQSYASGTMTLESVFNIIPSFSGSIVINKSAQIDSSIDAIKNSSKELSEINTNLTNIGTIYTTGFSGVTVTTTGTVVASLAVPAGTYLVMGSINSTPITNISYITLPDGKIFGEKSGMATITVSTSTNLQLSAVAINQFVTAGVGYDWFTAVRIA